MSFARFMVFTIIVSATSIGCTKLDPTSLFTAGPQKDQGSDSRKSQSCSHPLAKGQEVQDIIAGQFFSCDLRQGKVNCWGRTEPVPQMHDVTQLTNNSYRVCALASDGIHCWGCIHWMGGGCQDEPQLPQMAHPTEVALGDHHGCAIDGGSVKCWGWNHLDQLSVPKNLKNPRDLSTGYDFTCVRTDEGVRCWGLGYKCSFPYSSKECDESKEAGFQSFVSKIRESEKFRLTGKNLCVQDGQQARCWSDIALPANLDKLTNLITPSYWSNTFCSKTPMGLRCWNAYNNNVREIETPAIYSSSTKVAVGDGHFCSIVDGEAVCWGLKYPSQDYGQIDTPASERPCDFERHPPNAPPASEPDPNAGLQCSPAMSSSFCAGYNVGDSCDSPQGRGVCASTGQFGPANLPGCKCDLTR